MAFFKSTLVATILVLSICSPQVLLAGTKSISKAKTQWHAFQHPTTDSDSSVGFLIALGGVMLLIITGVTVIIYCLYCRSSPNSKAKTIKRGTLGTSGASRGSKQQLELNQEDREDKNNERMSGKRSLKTKRSKRQPWKSGGNRGSLKRQMAVPKKACKGKRKQSVLQKRSGGRSLKRSMRRKSRGTIKVAPKACGEQTMLLKQSIQFYKEILKSVHSVKSVSQYSKQ